jgi:hypothetical protein
MQAQAGAECQVSEQLFLSVERDLKRWHEIRGNCRCLLWRGLKQEVGRMDRGDFFG